MSLEGKGLEHGDGIEEEEVYEDAHGDTYNPVKEEVPTEALSSLTFQHVFKVRGIARGREMNILVDSGATSSFLDAAIIQKVECSVVGTNPLRVAVANGECMVSHAMCPNFFWTMDEEPFKADLMIFYLGTYDLVLGLDWMKQFGLIIIDLNKFTISFIKEGRRCEVKGIKKRPGQLKPQRAKKIGKRSKGETSAVAEQDEMDKG
ncbi:hypothetical protein Dimus_037966 [Dionaea muscipula]